MPRGRKKKAPVPRAQPPAQPPPSVQTTKPDDDDEEEDEYVKKIKEAAAAGQKITVTSSIQKLLPAILRQEKLSAADEDPNSFFAHAAVILARKPTIDLRPVEELTIEDDGEQAGTSSQGNGGEEKEKEKENIGEEAAAEASQSVPTGSSRSASQSQSEESDDEIQFVCEERGVSPGAVSSEEEDDAVVCLHDGTEESRQSEVNKLTDYEITIRVKVNGKLEKFMAQKDEKLEGVFKALAQLLHTSVNGFSLVRNAFEYLRPSDTPRTLGLGNVEILECVEHVAGESVPVATSGTHKRKATDASDITLKFQTGDRKCVVEMVVSKLDTFEIIKAMYAEQRGLNANSGAIKFDFDGETVPDTATPEDLGMDDDDCVDVIM